MRQHVDLSKVYIIARQANYMSVDTLLVLRPKKSELGALCTTRHVVAKVVRP